MEDVTSRKRGPVCVDTVEGMRSGKFLRIDDKCAVGQDPLTEGETPQSASLSVSCVDTEASSGRLAVVSDEGFHMMSAAWGERGVRKFMEDTHVLCLSLSRAVAATGFPEFPALLDAAIFAIFDGHGGRQTSTFCRDHLLTEIASEALRLFGSNPSASFYYSDRHVQKLLKAVCAKLDHRIQTELFGCKDGSTAILAFYPFRQLRPSNMFIMCLGDTAAYLSRTTSGTHHAIPLSEVHKPWMVKEKERIVQSGGTVESGRVNGLLEVSRSLGDMSFKKYGVISNPSLMKFAIDPEQDEFVLLGCDGFWLNWTAVEALGKTRETLHKETRRLVAQGEKDATPELKEICRTLVNHVLVEKKSQDNVSIILIQFRKASSEPNPKAT